MHIRAALGNPNNANNPGPISGGRREINWDGGGATTARVERADAHRISEYSRGDVHDASWHRLPANAAQRDGAHQHQPSVLDDVRYVQPGADLHAGGQQYYGRDVFVTGKQRCDAGDGGWIRCGVF